MSAAWTPPPNYNPYAPPHSATNPYDTQASWPSGSVASAPPPASDVYTGSSSPSSSGSQPTVLPGASSESAGQVFSQNTDDAGFGFGAKSPGYTGGLGFNAVSNVGVPYNSNMLMIDPSQKSQYKYTNTFSNASNKPETVTLWNKTGPDGQPLSGMGLADPVTFTLQPGQSQTMAFDSGSSVAWCVAGSGTPANSGQTWGEATFGSGNGGSGWDISQIPPAGGNGQMTITNAGTGSTITNANAYTYNGESSAGHDQAILSGPLDLVTTLS